ncbi:uncharacterized protein LOC108913732 [Anoplophora glabripennis]|uniref:uncharacterized protein LOC108913732 n=1 Tax=Anoplophora glabripennis TaxID=217634 RepID=UPI0008742CB3|nr:uncharacterized protein LOC108913732 [Anoplophora glabripennis]
MAISALALILCLLIEICSSKHIFVINSDPESPEDELVSVVALYRHGDRSPISSFPNDPYYNSSYWPEGYGQLLTKGIQRQYDLGKWLRTRYDTFLPADYSPKDILVYSTDIDRTLMSAEANLAGLYPPTESQVWEDGFFWQPIPVHLMATDDPVFAMNVDCPKFNKLQEELEASEFFENVYKENRDMLKSLSNFTGMNVSSLGNIRMIFEVLYIYRNHNESYLPSWVENIDQEKLAYLAGLGFAQATFTEELRRLGSGPFLNYLISYFSDVINNATDVSKFLMFSGHDGTIVAALGGMGVFDNRPPEFASAVIWELRRNTKKEYYVNVLHKKNSTDAYEQLSLDNCDFDCAFNDFKTNLEAISVDSGTWGKECEINDPEDPEDELVSVVALYRHGDRSPISSFPNDLYYNSSYWPEGYGQLLSKGILRQYNLGKWLRTRYDTFLPADYSPKDILVYSTDVDRTLMSAEANLAGLYPPTESQIWEDGFFWQPIPVHQMATDDPVFAMDAECPKFIKLQEELETSEFFENVYKENRNMLNSLSNLTGMKVSSLGNMRMIFEVLYIYRNHNESYLPSWVEDIDQEKLAYLAGLGFSQATFTEELTRLATGPFLNYLLSYFNDVINNATDVSKFLMFSGHDGTIAAALGGMGVFDNLPPEFASAVIWELRRNTKKKYYVNVLHKKNSTDAYEQLSLDNCGFDCAFNDFTTNLESIIIDRETWKKECEISGSVRLVFSWSLLFMVIVLKVLKFS